MITTLKPETTEEQRIQLIQWFEAQGVQVHEFIGAYQTVLGLIGDTSGIDVEMLELLDIVEKVTLISIHSRAPTGSSIRKTPSSTCWAQNAAADISQSSRDRVP